MSSAIALGSNSKDNNLIVIFNDFSGSNSYQFLLETKWKNSPFNKVLLLPRALDWKPQASKFKSLGANNSTINITRANIKVLDQEYKNIKGPTRIYTFNDSAATSQFLAYLNRKGENVYGEDGMAMYLPYSTDSEPIITRLFFKFYYGPWFKEIMIYGTYKHINKVMALNPELVIDELKDKKCEKITKKSLMKLAESGYVDAVLKEFNIKQKIKIENLLIIPPSRFVKKYKLKRKYELLISQLCEKMDSVTIKYHPRETDHFLGKINKPNLEIIPQSVPMEVLFLKILANPPNIIIGAASTALLTGRLLLSKSKVISLMGIFGLNNSEMEALFKKSNINVPKDNIEFEKLITN